MMFKVNDLKGIDYKRINLKLERKIDTELILNKNNAREELGKYLLGKFISVSKLSNSLASATEIQQDFKQYTKNAGSQRIVADVVNILQIEIIKEYKRNKKILMDLLETIIIDNDIQFILKDDLPIIIRLNKFIENKNYKLPDLEQLLENILNKLYMLDKIELTEAKMFIIINEQIEKTLKEDK